jgi:hypothetical protein
MERDAYSTLGSIRFDDLNVLVDASNSIVSASGGGSRARGVVRHARSL